MEEIKKEQKVPEHPKTDYSSKSEVAMWLDDYNDLFSDFDPKPYSQRIMSYDFLNELRRATKQKYGKIKLSILIPKDERDIKIDHIIKTRLKEYFRKHYYFHKKESKGVLKQGLLFCVFGVVLMFVATYILFYFHNVNLIMSFFIVLLEPAGWFLFWEGLNVAIFKSKEKKPLLDFYEKMSNCTIYFSSY
ncbi:hypothetical protein KY342_05910 [Candidatus Woesearchaeota archaeon]|nr:hypothetical protein [Candidatus Woesearchaeota archaeon]